MLTRINVPRILRVFITTLITVPAIAQTESDAIMMNRHQLCNGFVYNYSSWDHYWEGTFNRDNQNLGTVSTQAVMYMGAYGIRNNLNIVAGVPYVWTKASAGTLHGLSGVQDLSLFLKWKAYTHSFGKHKVSLFAIGGFQTPLSDYVIDFLPMSIGLGTTNLSAKGMVDYQFKKFTVTGSAAYVRRSNVKLDRDSYFDTQLRQTNEVQMPDVAEYQLRTGYRGKYIIAEAILFNRTTLGGFDMTKNNMPFPSNRMNATTVGVAGKYTFPKFSQLSLVGGGSYTVTGRNMGQATSFNVGAFYAFYLGKKTK